MIRLADAVRTGYDSVIYPDTTPGITAGLLEQAIKNSMETSGLDTTKMTMVFRGRGTLRFGDSIRATRLQFAAEVFSHSVSSFNDLLPEELAILRHFLEQPDHQETVTTWLYQQYGYWAQGRDGLWT